MQDFLKTLNTLGEGTFLMYSLTTTIVSIVIMVLVAKASNTILRKSIARHYKGDNSKFIQRMKTIFIYIVLAYGILSLFTPFRSLLTALAASGGVIAIVIGFAAQEAAGNFVNGLMIAIFKPFKIDDLIKVNNGELVGTVVDITLRHTVIQTFENTKIVIPNSIMDKAILENVTEVGSKKANFLEIEISYESNFDQAVEIIAEEVMKHKDFIDPRNDQEKKDNLPAVITRLVAFQESGMLLKTTIFSINNAQGYAMMCDLRAAIKRRFDAVGIEIPYPHRTIHIKEKNHE